MKLPLDKTTDLLHRGRGAITKYSGYLSMLAVGGGGLTVFLRPYWGQINDAWDGFVHDIQNLFSAHGPEAGQESLSAMADHLPASDVAADLTAHSDTATHAVEETMHHASPEILAESVHWLGKIGLLIVEHWHEFLPF